MGVNDTIAKNAGKILKRDGKLCLSCCPDECDFDVVSYSLTFHNVVECPYPTWPGQLNDVQFVLDQSAWNGGHSGKKWWTSQNGFTIALGCNYCSNNQAIVHVWDTSDLVYFAPFVGQKTPPPVPSQMNNFNATVGRCQKWDGSDCLVSNRVVGGYGGYVDIVPNY